WAGAFFIHTGAGAVSFCTGSTWIDVAPLIAPTFATDVTILSNSSSALSRLKVGRTDVEGVFGVVGTAGQSFAATLPGDVGAPCAPPPTGRSSRTRSAAPDGSRSSSAPTR